MCVQRAASKGLAADSRSEGRTSGRGKLRTSRARGDRGVEGCFAVSSGGEERASRAEDSAMPERGVDS